MPTTTYKEIRSVARAKLDKAQDLLIDMESTHSRGRKIKAEDLRFANALLAEARALLALGTKEVRV